MGSNISGNLPRASKRRPSFGAYRKGILVMKQARKQVLLAVSMVLGMAFAFPGAAGATSREVLEKISRDPARPDEGRVYRGPFEVSVKPLLPKRLLKRLERKFGGKLEGTCKGVVTVYFPPPDELQGEEWKDLKGRWSVSYRHKITIDKKDKHNPICKLVEKFSPLNEKAPLGSKKCNFYKRPSAIDLNPDGSKQDWPVRTIVPDEGKATAHISAPLCLPGGRTVRPKVEITKLELSADGKSMRMNEKHVYDERNLGVELHPFNGLASVVYDLKEIPKPKAAAGQPLESGEDEGETGNASGAK